MDDIPNFVFTNKYNSFILQNRDVDNFISHSNTTSATHSFIYNWQTLIGSALGPFLAILLSGIAFLLKNKLQEKDSLKESHRRVEVAVSQTLNHIYTSIEQLEHFLDRLDSLIKSIQAIQDDKTYVLNEINFPPTINIYFDEDLIKLKFKSYYIHNKLLIIEYIINWANNSINQFRVDFYNLVKKNEFILTTPINPPQQRAAYLTGLESFYEMLHDFTEIFGGNNTKTILQTKVYNLMLLKNYKTTLKKYEKIHIGFFNFKFIRKTVEKDLNLLDEIDNLIQKDVEDLIKKIDQRKSKKNN